MTDGIKAILEFFVDLFAAIGSFLSSIGSNFGGINIDNIINTISGETEEPAEEPIIE